MKISYLTLRSLLILANVTTPFAGYSVTYAAAPSSHQLPAPHISRSLDALLIPINKAVREKFKLAEKEHGVYVLSVKDGGTADAQGIRPGDVISEVNGHKVRKPMDVDVAARRSLNASQTSIPFGLLRDGAPLAVSAAVTLEAYNETISVSEVSTWESETSETSFSYPEYISEESAEIESSYESEELIVEEEASQEETSDDESASEDMEETDDSDGGDADAGDDGDGDGDDGE